MATTRSESVNCSPQSPFSVTPLGNINERAYIVVSSKLEGCEGSRSTHLSCVSDTLLELRLLRTHAHRWSGESSEGERKERGDDEDEASAEHIRG
jgi:hypothetical protein